MKILNERQILQKVKRLAIQILEGNLEEQSLILAGVNSKGMAFAQLLYDRLKAITEMPIQLINIRLNPAAPLDSPIEVDLPIEALRNQAIILVDDVANTGRTLFYACKPALETLPRKLEVVVLVDRRHKAFPIRVDYVGLSLATTLMENIEVQLMEGQEMAAYLN